MYCSNCGAKSNESSNFCFNCGRKIKKQQLSFDVAKNKIGRENSNNSSNIII